MTTPLDETPMVADGSTFQAAQTASKPTTPERTLWLIGSTAAAFEAVGPVLESITDQYPRIDLLYTARNPVLVPWLRAHAPGAMLVSRPSTLALFTGRAVRRLNPRLILLLDGIAPFEAGVLRAALHRQIPIALLATGGTSLTETTPALLDLVERFVALDKMGADALNAVASVRSRVIVSADSDRARAATAAADALLPLLRWDLKAQRSEQRRWGRKAERLAVAAVDLSWIRAITNARAERIATVDDLAAHLRHPRTILCLGNGPSSEDPRLRGIAYDRLFRVNHLWQERAFLADPDVVFTGSTETVRRMKRAIVAVSTIRHEGRILLTGFTRRSFRRFRFFTAERLQLLTRQPWWGGAVPTNGILMLATAVALKPERIIVAGMDMFRHQSGAYPGDVSTANAYTSRHDAEVEQRLLLEILGAHGGHVEVIGDVLRPLWEAHLSKRSAPYAVPARDGYAMGS